MLKTIFYIISIIVCSLVLLIGAIFLLVGSTGSVTSMAIFGLVICAISTIGIVLSVKKLKKRRIANVVPAPQVTPNPKHPSLICCSVCGKGIASTAKNCPSCGAKNKMPYYRKWWFWLLITAAILMAVIRGVNYLSQPALNIDQRQSNSELITISEFNRINSGMTLLQVQSIIGSKGSLVSQSNVDGYKLEIYSWDGDGVSNATITFENGKVINKTQIGLN